MIKGNQYQKTNQNQITPLDTNFDQEIDKLDELHEEKIEKNQISVRFVLERFMTSNIGKYVEQISCMLSLITFVLYVQSTYVDQQKWLNYLDYGVIAFYIFEYGINLYIAQHRFVYILSINSILDVITMLPIVMMNIVKIVQISRILRFLRVVRVLSKMFRMKLSNVKRQIFTIFLTIMQLVFVTSGIVLTFEKPKRIIDMKNDELQGCTCGVHPATFHEMIYFVVVTLATVGYGDITPQSEEGRVCVIFFIVLVIVLIPKQTNELIRLMGTTSIYMRKIYKYNSEVPHIIICGFVGVEALKSFTNELFHPDHGSQDKNAVILQSNIPHSEMELFLHDPLKEIFLTYLQGNAMTERDLKRAAATQAKACVVLTNKYINDAQTADHKNILTSLAIKKYVSHETNGDADIRLCLQLIKPESKTHFYSSIGNVSQNDQLIIIEEIKMNLLAKSCFSPGITALVSNLVVSAGEIDSENFPLEWMKEYAYGMGHEIYRTTLSPKFQNKSFNEMASIIYQELQAIVFALELDVGGHTIIRLNPGSLIPNTVDNNVFVYMICEDKKVADQVSTYDLSAEEIAQLHVQEKISQLKKEECIQNKLNEENEIVELVESEFFLLKEPESLMQCSRISLQDSHEVVNHIILCGMHSSIYYFILPLRAKYLKEFQYIVILAPEKPIEIWEYINRFPKILFVKGSPLLSEDLQRANIAFADKVVILGSDNENQQGQQQQIIDAVSIFTYKAIKKCNPKVQIMVELVYNSNIEFLFPYDVEKFSTLKHEMSPLFAAGEVYISSIVDTLTCQTYYNPHILTILQQILTGGQQSNAFIRAICDHAGLKQSNLWQIPVPEDYLNKTFSELFNYLCIDRNLIPLGLYRLPGALDNNHAYVYTNPKPNVKLTHRDKVFVLAANMPNDLLCGIIDKKALIDERYDSQNLNQKNLNEGQQFKQIQKEQEMQMNYQQPYSNRLKGNAEIDLENININSATYLVLDQVNSNIQNIKNEINLIKYNLNEQDTQIIEQVKIALRQELNTIVS